MIVVLLLFALVGVLLGNARTTPIGLLLLAVALWRGWHW